jgi:hypothetical protein
MIVFRASSSYLKDNSVQQRLVQMGANWQCEVKHALKLIKSDAMRIFFTRVKP